MSTINKYIGVFKIQWKAMVAYRFDVITSAAFSCLKIILSYVLWSAIFSTKSVIDGYTLNMMVSYFIFCNFISSLERAGSVSEEMVEEIRLGGFTKYILKPIHNLMYFASMSFSRTLYVVGINIAATLLWLVVFANYIVITNNIFNILLAMIMVILGLICLMLFNYLITMFTFWFLDISSLFVLKGMIIEFLTGTLIPLNMFPAIVTNIFKLTPFYYTVYYPSALLLDKNDGNSFLGIMVLLIWIIIFFFLDLRLYKKGIKKYEGVSA